MSPKEILARLFETAGVGAALEARSDAEVARLLDVAAGDMDMLSPLFELAMAAAGRLRRAAGGPYRECSWCENEAAEPVDEQWWCGRCGQGSEVPQ